MVTQFCQAESITLPEPYFADLPVSVKTCDDWTFTTKPIAFFLPHEWFGWLEGQGMASGFEGLGEFWKEHSMDDPKLQLNPMAEPWWQLVLYKDLLHLLFFCKCVLVAAILPGMLL
eukprot:s119_g27.t1